MWQNDDDLFHDIREKLFTGVVGDLLDTLGCLDQFLPPGIQPLRSDMIAVGRAMPVLEQDLTDYGPALNAIRSGKPFGLMLDALDDLKSGEIYICTGSSPAYATWGELMATRAMRSGCTGAVLNGYSRDTRGILALNFPTFSLGRYAQDQRPRGQVVDFRVPIQIGKVAVCPGDIVFGDQDGVIVIPRQVERDVCRLAIEKVAKEHIVRQAFEKDATSAREAFAKYGVM